MICAVEQRSARWAHNPEAAGSNPVGATKFTKNKSSMECKLTITGTISDIQQALMLLQGGPPISAEVQTFTPVNYRFDPPSDINLRPMERIDKPVTSKPWKKSGKKAFAKKKQKSVEMAEPLKLSERLCQTCGKPFIPSRNTSHHCSKKCYMIDWRDRNKPSARKDNDSKPGEGKTDLSKKLEEFRKNCPSPAPRPSIQRYF